jgi:hypothetical protein
MPDSGLRGFMAPRQAKDWKAGHKLYCQDHPAAPAAPGKESPAPVDMTSSPAARPATAAKGGGVPQPLKGHPVVPSKCATVPSVPSGENRGASIVTPPGECSECYPNDCCCPD